MHDSANATNAANGSPPRPTIRPFDVPAAGPAPVKPIPDDYPRVVPYLCVTAAGAAIEFYRTVFDATERMRMAEPGEQSPWCSERWRMQSPSETCM